MTRINARSIAGVFVTLLAVGSAVASAQTDPRIGKWKVNLAKSKYELGPAPKDDVRTYEATPDGTKTKIEITPTSGSPRSGSYTAKLDGKDYPITGTGGPSPFDTIALKPVNGSTLQITLKKDGKVVQTTRAVVSKDGKTMTQTSTRPDASGKKDVVVFDKQP
jgi:hypothetical protein